MIRVCLTGFAYIALFIWGTMAIALENNVFFPPGSGKASFTWEIYGLFQGRRGSKGRSEQPFCFCCSLQLLQLMRYNTPRCHNLGLLYPEPHQLKGRERRATPRASHGHWVQPAWRSSSRPLSTFTVIHARRGAHRSRAGNPSQWGWVFTFDSSHCPAVWGYNTFQSFVFPFSPCPIQSSTPT